MVNFIYNEYFGSAGRRKCPCNSNLQSYFWGAYIGRIFHSRTVFCLKCFEKEVKTPLLNDFEVHKLTIAIKGFRNERLPEFLLELRDLLSGNPQLRLLKEINVKSINMVLPISQKEKMPISKSLSNSPRQRFLF